MGVDGCEFWLGPTKVAKPGRGEAPPSSRNQSGVKPHHRGKSGRGPTKFTKAIGGEAPSSSRLTVTRGHRGVGAKPSFVPATYQGRCGKLGAKPQS